MLWPSEGGLGGQDAPDRFPASGRNAYPSGANAFFADTYRTHGRPWTYWTQSSDSELQDALALYLTQDSFWLMNTSYPKTFI